MLKYLLAIAPLSLLATVNIPWRCEVLSGYRNDRIHWHLQLPENGSTTYSELNRDLQYWENGIALHSVYRDLSFYARGTFGAFGPGDVFQTYSSQSFTSESPSFQFSRHGWCASAFSYVGYAVNLTADRVYKVVLTPLLGMSYHYEQLKSKGEGSPNSLEGNGLAGATYQMSSTLPAPLGMKWYSVFLGGSFWIDPGSGWNFEAGYGYNWTHASLNTSLQNTVSIYQNGALQSTTDTLLSIDASEGGNLGHTGWLQMDYALDRYWRFGLGGQINYFVTKFFNTDATQQTPTVQTAPRVLKLRWTSLSGWLILSREI